LGIQEACQHVEGPELARKKRFSHVLSTAVSYGNVRVSNEELETGW
jgi:hypothetical protein